jgi:hypothetical protein
MAGSGGRVGGVGHSFALQRDSDPGAMLAGKGCDSDAVPPGPAPPVLAPDDASEAQPHPIVLEPQHEPARRGISLAGLVRVLQQNVQIAEVPLERLCEPD